jgi:hypothetical protein
MPVDQRMLVETQVDDGQMLLDRLVEEGVRVTAAAWLKEADGGYWFFYIATPLVNATGGILAAYRRVDEVKGRLPEHPWIGPSQIKLVAPRSPVAKAVHAIHTWIRGPSAARCDADQLGEVEIQGAYIYPPIGAPAR